MLDPEEEDAFGEELRLADDLGDSSSSSSAPVNRSAIRARATEPEMDERAGGKTVSRADLSRWFVGEDEEMPEAEGEAEEGEVEEKDKDELMTLAAEEADRLHRELLEQGTTGGGERESVKVIDERATQEDLEKAVHTTNQAVSLPLMPRTLISPLSLLPTLPQNLYEALVETRIRMQPLLVAANRLPRPGVHQLFRENEEEEGIPEKMDDAAAGASEVLRELDGLDCELWNRHPELVETAGRAEKMKEGEDDLDEQWRTIAERGERFGKWQAMVLEKWHERTQIGVTSGKKFKAVNLGVVRQIEQALEDKQRLIKRTRQRRTMGRVLGEPRKEEGTAQGMREGSARAAEKEKDELDEEVFDDADFYGDLLRELIDSTRQSQDGLEEAGDFGIAASELNRLRRQPKKKNLRYANKGRALKFDPQPEIVNFMAPIDQPTAKAGWDTQQLFSNLFGLRSAAAPS